MPVRNYPFSAPKGGSTARPYLPVTIINPATGQKIQVLALIDTGADECAIPAFFAPLLGHNLEAGTEKKINTVNGIATAYSHTAQIEIEGFTTQQELLDFLPNLSVPLLGVRSFLSNFILIIDYPNKTFSLQK
jgi:predicted aspartyl protease